MLSPSTQKRQISFQLYKLKKNKQPDHLLSLISKSKKQQQNLQLSQNQSLDSKVRQAIRRHMIEKRVSNILNQNTRNINMPVSEKNNFKDKSNAIISQPVKCLQKPWIPPIQKQVLQKKFSQQQLVLQAKRAQQRLILNNKTQLTQLLNTINLNKKMLFFGNYLSSQFDSKNNTNRKSISLATIPKTKESKLSFLESRYKQLVSNVNKRPKLFVMNSVVQEEKGFFNPLQHDEYYGTIMKVQDKELMKILVKALEEEGRFTLTSFTRFYEIFVWQSATRQDLTRFAAKILMLDKDQLSITEISIRIDEICQKINLQQLNHSLENFSQIMKKLLFGEEFVFALKNEYFLTRKALIQSLQRNQQCISIFINVFYV